MPAIILLPAISFLTTHPVSPNTQCQSRLLNLANLLCIFSFHWELSGLPSFSWRMRFYLVKIIQLTLVCLSRQWITLICSTALQKHWPLDLTPLWTAAWRGGDRYPEMMFSSWLEHINEYTRSFDFSQNNEFSPWPCLPFPMHSQNILWVRHTKFQCLIFQNDILIPSPSPFNSGGQKPSVL